MILLEQRLSISRCLAYTAFSNMNSLDLLPAINVGSLSQERSISPRVDALYGDLILEEQSQAERGVLQPQPTL